MADGGDLMSERHTVEISGELLVLVNAIRNREQTNLTDLVARTKITMSRVSHYTHCLVDMGLITITNGRMHGQMLANVIRWTGEKP